MFCNVLALFLFCTRAHAASFHLASSQPWLPLSECSLCVHLARVCVRRRMMRNSTLCVHLKCVPSSSCCSRCCCCSCCSHTVAAARARLCVCVCVCAPLPPPPLPAASCCCPRREEKRNPHEEKNVCNAHTRQQHHSTLFFRDQSQKSKNINNNNNKNAGVDVTYGISMQKLYSMRVIFKEDQYYCIYFILKISINLYKFIVFLQPLLLSPLLHSCVHGLVPLPPARVVDRYM